MSESKMLSAANDYAENGFKVFPITPNKKTPLGRLVRNGFHNATNDIEQIEMWWTDTPDANIGLDLENLVVIDIDGADHPWLNDPEMMTLLSSADAMSITPHGGRHYFYRIPEGKSWSSVNGKLAEHVDVKTGNTGYVVVSPSSIDGKDYRWAESLELTGPNISEPPFAMSSMLDKCCNGKVQKSQPTNKTDDLIPKGQRNDALARLAGTMRRAGRCYDEIFPSILITNNTRCESPLPENEVSKIVSSICRYEPNQVCVEVIEGHWDQIRHLNGDEKLAVDLLDNIDTKPVQHLWRNRFYLEGINIIVGMPEGGKSSLVSDICARVTTGRAWPDDPDTPQAIGRVLYIQCEDSVAATIKPRFENHNGDAKMVDILRGVKVPQSKSIDHLALTKHIRHLDQYAAKHPDLRLIVFDPLTAYLGKVDSHKDAEVRSVLGPLQALAEKYCLAVLGIMHTNKSQMQAMFKVSGSIAFAGIARSVWMVAKESDDFNTPRLFVQIKNNLAPNPGGLSYNLVNCENDRSRVEWNEGRIDTTADEILSASKGGDTKLDEAVAWIENELKDGPIKALDLNLKAATTDIKTRTMRRARGKLKVHRYKDKGIWFVCLPGGRKEDS